MPLNNKTNKQIRRYFHFLIWGQKDQHFTYSSLNDEEKWNYNTLNICINLLKIKCIDAIVSLQ